MERMTSFVTQFNDCVVLRLEAPYQALALDRFGNDVVDGCVTRTVECKGLENPARTRLVWDATTSEDTPASVTRTVKCNAARQWILSQDGEQIAVKEVGCLATTKPPDEDRCKECAPIDVVLGGPFMGKAMNVGVGADDRGCAISTVECRGEDDPLRTSIVWNDGEFVSEDTPAVVERTLKCNANAEWILTEGGASTVIKKATCVAVGEKVVPKCQKCARLPLNQGAGWEVMAEDVDGVTADGCLTRSFECRGWEDAVQTELVWNGGAVAPSADTPASVRRSIRCSDAEEWILEEARPVPVVVKEVGCRVRKELKDCRRCAPVVVNPGDPMGRDEAGVDADGCATRTFRCDGVENPLITALVWNKQEISRGATLDSVERTVTCNDGGQWILKEGGKDIPVTEVACDAKSDECKKCTKDLPVDPNFPIHAELGPQNDRDCATLDLICGEENVQRAAIRWNDGDDGDLVGEDPNFVFEQLFCNNRREWVHARNGQLTVIRKVACLLEFAG
uniref:Ig-like domain-containing protein n=1 Tax=Steinernema glaseri TaxID=37863 RepID=A0A1I8A791_9BILA